MSQSSLFIQTIKRISLSLLIVLSLGLPLSLSAQKNFQPGFIITQEGDTINGQIDYQNWSITPRNIKFKGSDQRELSFNSLDISGFRVADEFYTSAVVQIETSPTLTNELNDVEEYRFEQKFIFLQALVLGEKSLFHLQDENAKDHFYVRVGNEYQLLLYKRYLNGRFVVRTRTYQGQLASYLEGCDKANAWIEYTLYNKRNLLQLFEKYYKCKGKEAGFKKEVDKLKNQIRAIAGLSITSASFKGTGTSYLSQADFDQSASVAVGVSAEIYLSNNLQRLSIQNEMMVSNYNLNGTAVIEDNGSFAVSTYNAELGFTYLKINNIFRYNFKLNNALLFAGAGISNGFGIRSTNFVLREIVLFNNSRFEESKAVEPSRNYEQGLLFSLGLKRSKYSIEVRLERGNGMANGDGVSSNVNRTFLLFGYQL